MFNRRELESRIKYLEDRVSDERHARYRLESEMADLRKYLNISYSDPKRKLEPVKP